MHSGRTPLVILASIDPVAREVALTNALLDRPDAVAIVHDIDVQTPALVRRVMSGPESVDTERVYLDHLCPSCAVREDAVPTIARLLRTGRTGVVILALPISAELEPASQGLTPYTQAGAGLDGAFVASTVAVVDPSELLADAFGTAMVDEREARLAPEDDRTVAEALAGQIPQADAVLHCGTDDVGAAVSNALRASDSVLWPDVHTSWLAAASAGRHDPARAVTRRCQGRSASGAIGGGSDHVPADNVWSLDLLTTRGVHPVRLLDIAAELADGPRMFWGTFWVPDRPGCTCTMYGAGHRVSLGEEHAVEHGQRRTAIRLVGLGADRSWARDLLEEMLLTPEEERACPQSWLEHADELEPFLGPRAVR